MIKPISISDIGGNFYPLSPDGTGFQHITLSPGWNSLYAYGVGTDMFSDLIIHTQTEIMTPDWKMVTVESNSAFGKTTLICIGTVDNKKEWLGDRMLSTYMPHTAALPGAYYILMVYTPVGTDFNIRCYLRN